MREHLLDRVVEQAPFAVEELARPVGQGRAGGDSVDQDSVRSELQGHGLGEVDDARLRGHERALEPQRDQPRDRSNVDDPPRALFDHHPGANRLTS